MSLSLFDPVVDVLLQPVLVKQFFSGPLLPPWCPVRAWNEPYSGVAEPRW